MPRQETFDKLKAVNPTSKNEVNVMENDDTDTLILTPEEREKILKDLLSEQKEDEDQEED